MEAASQQTVSFGRPVTEPYLIPVIHNSTPSCINVPFMVEGDEYRVTSFSLHGSTGARTYGVVITDNVDIIDISFHGRALANHPLFPSGADIVFVQIESKDLLKARFYEKEEGVVSFSERGACAAFIAAKMMQKTFELQAVVEMDGKTCRVEWDGVDGEVSLTR